MFSPAMVTEVRQNAYNAERGKKHALLDKLLQDLQPEPEVRETPSANIRPAAPIFPRCPAPQPAAPSIRPGYTPPEEDMAPAVRFGYPATKKILFSDFLKNGWTQQDDLFFSFPTENETTESLENIKSQFGDFAFLLDCGRGSFGHVWLVKDMTGIIMALKIIPKKRHQHLQEELYGLTLYRQNIRNFKNLVQIYHVGNTRDFFFYTMEAAYSLSQTQYIPLTLRNMLDLCNFESRDGYQVIRALLDGISELHTHSLSHRDIKPDNIIFVDGIPKLSDIGLVEKKALRSSKGTSYFLPPDLSTIENVDLGVACDLYATGKVLYSMLANKTSFRDFPCLPRAILKNPLGKKLNKVINTACAETQKLRFQSTLEFISALVEEKNPPAGFWTRLIDACYR